MHAVHRIAAQLDQLGRIDRAHRHDGLRQAERADLPHDGRAIGVVGDDDDAIGVAVADADQRRAEVALLRDVALGHRDLGAVLLRRLDEMVAAGAAPIRIEVQHRELLQAEAPDGIGRQQRLLVGLADGRAPHEVAALGEIGM